MKKIQITSISFFLLALLFACSSPEHRKPEESLYTLNRAPLRQNTFIELPLGTIKPSGWLHEMLIRQRDGLTGKLDELYPLVMGNTNGWLGGDGDQWERGPYWIDGLLPLAYILEDTALIAKTRPWIEWTFASRKEDGYFGPDTDYPNDIPGVQRDNCGDWWPKMVMLKVLQQYYSATGDERAIQLMTDYFRYQLKNLPEQPLDHWTFWPRYRGGDNLMCVYWLYNITGDKFLLELGELIYRQTFPFDKTFAQDNWWHTGSMHCVNLTQGMKTPVIYYQYAQDSTYLNLAKKGLNDINRYISGPHGSVIGDEALHGNNPTQGSELCTIVEMMFSLEQMLQITGDTDYAGQLERIAFNALPAQTTDDYMNRQYFQQVNQVEVSVADRNFDTNHHGTDICFGLLSGYPCCTSNMHQGWPKFTQNLFYATPDNGVAAMVYAPSSVRMKVADGQDLSITEETDYPFEEKIRFRLSLSDSASFPFYLRIPDWCESPVVSVNGSAIDYQVCENGTVKISRTWKSQDAIELYLPMKVVLSEWHERAKSVERGPLVYALSIDEEWKWKPNSAEMQKDYGDGQWEVYPASPWNYALTKHAPESLQHDYIVEKNERHQTFVWNKQNAPLKIRTKARRIPNWTEYNHSAGPLPYSIQWGAVSSAVEEEIMLIPYGCTTLRITEFPILGEYVIK